jgi:hypothetical protein
VADGGSDLEAKAEKGASDEAALRRPVLLSGFGEGVEQRPLGVRLRSQALVGPISLFDQDAVRVRPEDQPGEVGAGSLAPNDQDVAAAASVERHRRVWGAPGYEDSGRMLPLGPHAASGRARLSPPGARMDLGAVLPGKRRFAAPVGAPNRLGALSPATLRCGALPACGNSHASGRRLDAQGALPERVLAQGRYSRIVHEPNQS